MPKAKKTKTKAAVAIMGSALDGSHHVVGLGNIRVVLLPEDGYWFAQGLEIDYAVQGSSLEDAKKQFEDGLMATIDEHLKVFGSIEKILCVAPPDVWHDVATKGSKLYRLNHASFHSAKQLTAQIDSPFPYKGIDFFAPMAAECG